MFAEDGERSYSGPQPTSVSPLSVQSTKDTPVADMLEHSPHLPLVIDYFLLNNDDITAEDEEGAILALKQCHRIRRVRLFMSSTSLQKLIAIMDEEYPVLEFLIIRNLDNRTTMLTFPETLQASSTASTPSRADRFRPSDRISIAHDSCGPHHTLSYCG